MSRLKRLADYAATIGITALTSLSMLLVVGVLARYLDRDEFTAYSVVTRYLGFIVMVCGMALSFAFIRAAGRDDREAALRAAATARTLVALVTAAMFVLFLVALLVVWRIEPGRVSWLTPFVYLWVMSQASFNLSNPYARFIGGVRAYARLYLVSKVAAILVAGASAALAGRYEVFFIVLGVISLLYQGWLWRDTRSVSPRRLDRTLARDLLRFSSSRWLDGLVRLSFPVVLITASGWFIGAGVAGSIAIVYLVAKSMESLLQPLVVAIMMRTTDRGQGADGVGAACLVAGLITATVYLARPLVEAAFGLYLGAAYAELVTSSWIVLLSAGSIIALNYLKALNDNRFTVSPMMRVNLLSLVLLLGVGLCDSVPEVAVLIAVLHIGRFLLYTMVIGWPGGGRSLLGRRASNP